ncbi:MAG: hypothetical protein IPJ89_02295 [Candidatus Iainarchaeum archaeon]|uniref:Uncharacterized protein n=1 Tax=Candidatus Iainarchaeum sp. TaxID=3101447 RepID=A0A7T9I1I2_9ARCH|nr:MAG: hypothetical protein IPJ89_02295 [Candidatus Diapherotrites archaeon]
MRPHFDKKNKSPLLAGRPLAREWIFLGIGAVLLLLVGGFMLFMRPPLVAPTLSDCMSIDRNAYGISPAVFGELPSPTKCARSTAKAFRDGAFTDAFFFSPSDYLQPEFYGNFEEEGIKYWTAPVPYHYGAVGFGAFPQERLLILAPGESQRVRVFLHAGYGIRTTQGMSIQPRYGHPLDAERVQVELSQDVREGFTLGPSFPKFSPTWARPVDVVVSVSPTSAPGTITISFATQPPSNQAESVFRSQYGFYFNATDYIGSQIPFQFKVKVVSKK